MNKFLKLLITLKLCTILIEEYYEKQHYTNKNPIVVNETENIEEEFHSIYKIESKFIKRKSDWLYPIFFRSKKKLNLNKSNSAINVLGLPVRPINFLYSYSDFLSAYSQRNKQSPSSYRIKEYADIIQTLKKFSLFYGSISTKKIIFYLAEAKKMPGNYTKNFLCLIESRLDIAIYRSGFAPSIAAARCLCSQGHVYINSKKVTTPGILLKSGDVIKVREISNISKKLENSLNFDLLNIEPFSLQQIQINEVQQLINKLENKTSFINFDTSYAKDKFNSLKKSLFYLNSSSPINKERLEKIKNLLFFFSIYFLLVALKARTFRRKHVKVFTHDYYLYRNTAKSEISKVVCQLTKKIGRKSLKAIQFFKILPELVVIQRRQVPVLYTNLLYLLINVMINDSLFRKKQMLNYFENVEINMPYLDTFIQRKQKIIKLHVVLKQKEKLIGKLVSEVDRRNLKKMESTIEYISRGLQIDQRKQFLETSKEKLIHNSLNLEIAKSINAFIYLYSPQRIQLPFLLNIDTLKKVNNI